MSASAALRCIRITSLTKKNYPVGETRWWFTSPVVTRSKTYHYKLYYLEKAHVIWRQHPWNSLRESCFLCRRKTGGSQKGMGVLSQHFKTYRCNSLNVARVAQGVFYFDANQDNDEWIPSFYCDWNLPSNICIYCTFVFLLLLQQLKEKE